LVFPGAISEGREQARERPKQTCKTKGASMKKAALLFVLVSAIFHLSLDVAASGVVCNEFDVTAEISGRELVFRLSTDLPYDTIVMASVSRLYWQEGQAF